MYMACGIDCGKSTIFNQSGVEGYHESLHWLLSSITPMGWLDRMTQYKDKKEQSNCLGLYSYPVLMASDVLLYKTTLVPVGHDQTQHVQLIRDVAGAFNRRYDTDFFKLPEAYINEKAPRIMSLRDGTKKMSKSDPSDYSRVNLFDSPELIKKKIQKAITDEAGMKNLITIWKSLGGSDIIPDSNSKFKSELSDMIIEELSPIQFKFDDIPTESDEFARVIDSGCWNASLIADKTLSSAKKIMGLL